MNRKKIRILTLLLSACICMLSIIGPVWGAETEDSAGEAYTSPVITAGSAEEDSPEESPADEEVPDEDDATETLLGTFITTGYCGCEKCSGGFNLTYSGTVPRAGHTISADLDVFPIGTELMIDGVVYTVEDRGSSVNGHKLDIYYASHEEAIAHGRKTQEVYSVTD